MGNTLSSWGGKKRVQAIIQRWGLPLQIDADGPDEDSKAPLSPFTEAYPASGWFTGVKSTVTIPRPPDVVFASLSKDLQKVFSPITECHDEIEEDDGKGGQVIFRVVRIPFKVAFVTGNLKLRLHVEQDSRVGQIKFESVKEGRLIKRFCADFAMSALKGNDQHTLLQLDAKISANQLPPAPFKNMVKDVMVRKMDACMVDLVNYHTQKAEQAPAHDIEVDGTGGLQRKASQRILSTIRKSFSRRTSIGKRPSLEQARSMSRQGSIIERLPSLRIPSRTEDHKRRDWQDGMVT